jgi:hypothetical protein
MQKAIAYCACFQPLLELRLNVHERCSSSIYLDGIVKCLRMKAEVSKNSADIMRGWYLSRKNSPGESLLACGVSKIECLGKSQIIRGHRRSSILTCFHDGHINMSGVKNKPVRGSDEAK